MEKHGAGRDCRKRRVSANRQTVATRGTAMIGWYYYYWVSCVALRWAAARQESSVLWYWYGQGWYFIEIPIIL